MAIDNPDHNTSRIHIAAKFEKTKRHGYDKKEMREYVETMLEDTDIIYSSVLMLDGGDDIVTIQVKFSKATVNSGALTEVLKIFQAMDGLVDTWILTESVMKHPEIYK